MNPIKKKIAADLKAVGYSMTQVSIKNLPGGSSTSLKMTIRDPKVSYALVEEIEQRYRSTSRDEKTMEILSGGNTFVDLELSDEVRKIWSKPYLPKIQAAIGQLVHEDHGVDIDERFSIFRERAGIFKVRDHLDTWLTMQYCRATDIAIDLYILDAKLQEKIPKDFVFKYWSNRFWADKQVWRTEKGHRDVAAMLIETAEYFKCASENGDSPKEKKIAEHVREFFNLYPAFAF